MQTFGSENKKLILLRMSTQRLWVDTVVVTVLHVILQEPSWKNVSSECLFCKCMLGLAVVPSWRLSSWLGLLNESLLINPSWVVAADPAYPSWMPMAVLRF